MKVDGGTKIEVGGGDRLRWIELKLRYEDG